MKVETHHPANRRVVVDTNVWLSAALSIHGAPAQVVQRLLGHGVPVFSASTFAELETRLWKPKFDRYLNLTARQEILHDAAAVGFWVEVSGDLTQRRFSRDVDDDKFVHAALAACASWLVTGDQDLLVLDAPAGVTILTPAAALLSSEFCR